MLQKAKASKYRTHNVSIFVFLIVISMLFVSSCGPAPTPAPAAPDPEVIAKYRDADTKPEGVNSDGINIDDWKCDGICTLDENGHTLTLNNVPDNVTAYLAPIPAEDIAQLSTLDKEGFTCLNTVIGNLTFYDNETRKLVDTFEKPVTIQLDYTYADLAAVKECGSKFEDKELWNDLVPGYLFMSTDDTNINIWKPFSNYKVEPLEFDAKAAPETIAGTISIEFSFWGDRPIIGGSPKE